MASTIASLFGPSPEQIEYDEQQARRVQQENRYTTNLAGLKGDLPGMATGYVAGMGIGEGLGQAAQGIFGMEPTKDPALARSKKTRELFSQFEDADFNDADVLSKMGRAFADGGLLQEGMSLQQAAADIRSSQPERFFTATGKSLMERDPVRYEGLLEDATYEVSDKTGLPKELVKGKDKPRNYDSGDQEIPRGNTNIQNAADTIIGLLDEEEATDSWGGLGGTWVSGKAGAAVASNEFLKADTPRLEYEGAISTLKANTAFDTLKAMRDASPTGGALGQVSEKELKLLEDAVVNLNPNLSSKVMRKNIATLVTAYNKELAKFPQEVLIAHGFNPDLSGYQKERGPDGELVVRKPKGKSIDLSGGANKNNSSATSRFNELNGPANFVEKR
jgi:hypothetical protein